MIRRIRRHLLNYTALTLGCAAVVLGAFVPHAWASIADGENAFDVLGQYDGTSLSDPQPAYTKAGVNDGPNRLGFGGASGAVLDSTHHRFFMSDSGNNRVFVYNLNTDNTFPDRIADNVLGQPNFISNIATATASGMSNVQGLVYDSVNNRLFAADSSNNRILVFDVTTIVNGQNAINVLGQPNFTSNTGTTTQSGLRSVGSLAYDTSTSRLFVGDFANLRVVVFNVASITDGQNAVNVLGQINFTTSIVSNTQSGINAPSGLAYDNVNNRLFVSQASNHRVSVFNVASITNAQSATNVLGQTTFTGTGSGNTQGGMNSPRGIVYDSATSRLFVAQSGNHRVTVYNVTTTITNGQNAVNVLGQTLFTGTGSAATQGGMNSPQGLVYDSGTNRLFVMDSNNRRVLFFGVASITNGQNATDALGQYDGANVNDPQPVFTKSAINNGPNRYGYNSLVGIALDSFHHRFFAADRNNNRVLVYNLNADNTFPDRVPDNVLGQPNFMSSTAVVSQAGLFTPYALAYDGIHNRLFVAQDASHRVSVYDVSAISDGQNAVNVLGQPDFTSSAATTTQSGLNTPEGLAYDSANDRLFVGEFGNGRVLVFDVSAITNGQNAVHVLGQPNFTAATFGTTQTNVGGVNGLAYDTSTSRLFVVGNHRVMIFDVSSIIDNQNAINVLGQIDFTSSVNTTTQSGMGSLSGITYDSVNHRLFVADYIAPRITVYDLTTITNGQNATNVLGQPTFTSKGATTTQSGLALPSGLLYDAGTQRLYVAEGNNNRVSVFDAGPAAAPLANPAGTPIVSALTTSTLALGLDTSGNPSSVVYAVFNTTDGVYVTASGSASGATTIFFASSSWSGVVTGLAVNKGYQFSVLAQNSAGINAATSSLNGTVFTLANPAGTPVISSSTIASLAVAWSNNNNPSSTMYALYNATAGTYVDASGITSGSAPSFFTLSAWSGSVRGLISNTSYQFSVIARNGNGVTGATTSVSVAVATLPLPAGTPVASLPTTSTLALVLDTAGNPPTTTYALYNVTTNEYLAQDGSSSGGIPVFFVSSSWNGTVLNLARNTPYQFEVISEDGVTSTASVPVFTLANPASSATAFPMGSSSIDVQFGTISNPSSTVYALYDASLQEYIDATGALVVSPFFQTALVWGFTISVHGLSPNTAHQIGVIARNGDGVVTATTSASVATTFADIPVTLMSSLVSSNSLTLTWSGNATDYYAESVTAGTNSGWLPATFFTFSNLGCNASYYFRVKGRNSAGMETDFSSSTLLFTGDCSSGGPGAVVGVGGQVNNGGSISSPIPVLPNTLPTVPVVTSSPSSTVVTFPTIPPPIPAIADLFFSPLFPTSGIKFITFPDVSTLHPGQAFSFTYSYSSPFLTRQTIHVTRDLRTENDKRVVLGYGNRTLNPAQNFSFKAIKVIPKTASTGKNKLVVHVYSAQGKLIDQNEFRLEIKK